MHEIRRLGALAQPPLGSMAVSILMASLAVAFGVALMTSAGYLISRAAEQPPILSLTVVIVAVRFFGLARPLARYCERLVSHDAALRALATIRSRFYERIEPLAPAQLREYRSGELLARMVGDVDALQSLYVRGLGPPIVALLVGAASVAVAAVVLPAAGAILAVGLLLAGLVVPLAGSALSRAASRRQAGVRGQLTAELVEVLRGAPELVAYGREEETLRRVRAADRELARLARRDALAAGLAEALSILVVGATVAGVLAVAVAAHETAALDRVLVATLALLALASFDAVAPLPVAARELFGSLAAGRRVLDLTDRQAAIRDPAVPAPAPSRSDVVSLEGVTARYEAGEEPALSGFELRLEPGTADRARRPERSRQDHGRQPPSPLPRSCGRPRDGRRPRRARVPAGGHSRALRARRPGRSRLQLDDSREPRSRGTGRERRRAVGCAPARAARGVGALARARPRHARR